jgi:hypothetical protein
MSSLGAFVSTRAMTSSCGRIFPYCLLWSAVDATNIDSSPRVSRLTLCATVLTADSSSASSCVSHPRGGLGLIERISTFHSHEQAFARVM